MRFCSSDKCSRVVQHIHCLLEGSLLGILGDFFWKMLRKKINHLYDLDRTEYRCFYE